MQVRASFLYSGVAVVLIAIVAFLQRDSALSAQSVELPTSLTGVETPSVHFLAALGVVGSPSDAKSSLDWIEANWSDQLLPYYIEIRRFVGVRDSNKPLWDILSDKTGFEDAADFDKFAKFVWTKDIENTPDYAFFKQLTHKDIDGRFEKYFEPDRRFDIRLDEVAWGGVHQDGIPPLRGPEMITAEDAAYLDDSNVVFGIELNGDARAYPKRILAWHEMFVDEVGGIDVAGVYCTLCGTVIIYHTEHNGVKHQLGTSGFLYRSNKLMYDQATQSLWSTLDGKPVIGPLVGKGIQLKQSGLVTTTWGEWKKRHPDTKVLSLKTGHRRDYGEGVAYHAYFATDERMFETPYDDNRLKNKDEILTLRFGRPNTRKIAISADYLAQNPIYSGEYGGQSYIILTDKTGANRVFERSEQLSFTSWDQANTATDSAGNQWTLSEDALTAKDGRKLKRLPAHRAFWFGWHGAFPETDLIK